MNLINVNVVSVYHESFPAVAGESIYINAKRIVGLQSITYTSGGSTLTGALISYAINIKGWRDNYVKIVVSQTVAQITSAALLLSSGKKIVLPVTKQGSTVLTSSTNITVNVDDVVLIRQSTADATIASPGQCEVWIQQGVWSAPMWVVSLTPAAVVALARTTSGIVTQVVTIGYPGSGVDNFNFTSAANKTAQNIQIATVPAFAVINSVTIINTSAFAGGSVSALGVTLGNASADNGILASTDLHAANSFAAGTLTELALSASAVNIWLGATPTTANWNQLTAGQLKLVISYTDVANS